MKRRNIHRILRLSVGDFECMPRKRENKKRDWAPFNIQEFITLLALPILTLLIIGAVKLSGNFLLSNHLWVFDILSYLITFFLSLYFLKFVILKLETKMSQRIKIFFLYSFAVVFGLTGKFYPPDIMGTFSIFFISQYWLLCLDVLSKKFDKSDWPRKSFEKRRWPKSRALGALLCIAVAAAAVAHIWYGYVVPWRNGGHTIGFVFALPVTVGLLVVLGVVFWLGWIMATTKDASPAVMTAPEEKPAEKKDKRGTKGRTARRRK
jgi:hypothetical protein